MQLKGLYLFVNCLVYPVLSKCLLRRRHRLSCYGFHPIPADLPLSFLLMSAPLEFGNFGQREASISKEVSICASSCNP